ncbi:hypothetical protein QC761_608170 [Podospora bellae-mahoneyi]|uniref:Uncharacterized protein n=1 Tax=Podospora bellae-mahoneyi TaxID=2093777 RepID=A0ABR0FCZ6_9PEZI|nr:hypothetical protein QC761_608170 [Podospora bellae-mahoneyi]
MSQPSQNVTLSSVSPQPLPAGLPLHVAVFDTVWFLASVTFTWLLYRLLPTFQLPHLGKREWKPAWPEFKPVALGAMLLTLWYFLTMIDRWMRQSGNSQVKYEYVTARPIYDVFHVTSTLLLVWGTYNVLWKRFGDRKPDSSRQRVWWFVSKSVFFVISLVSVLYLVFYFAFSLVWVKYESLVPVVHFAARGSSFEIATVVLVWVASMAMLGVYRFFGSWGHEKHSAERWYLWGALAMFFARSLAEVAVVLKAQTEKPPQLCLENHIGSGDTVCVPSFGTPQYIPPSTGDSNMAAIDIPYGLFSILFLVAMWLTARETTGGYDQEGNQQQLVMSDIRSAVLQKLQERTNQRRKKSPPFREIMDEIEEDLDKSLESGPLARSLATVSPQYKRQAALACIQELRDKYEGAKPRYGTEDPPGHRLAYNPQLPSLGPSSATLTPGAGGLGSVRGHDDEVSVHGSSLWAEASIRTPPETQRPRYHPAPSSYSVQELEVPNQPLSHQSSQIDMVPAETTPYYPSPPMPAQAQQRPLGRAASMGRLDPIPPPGFTSPELWSHGAGYDAYNPVHSMSQDAIPPVPVVPGQFPATNVPGIPLAAASQGYRTAAMPRPAALRSQAARGVAPGPSMVQQMSRPMDMGGGRSVSDPVVLTPFLARAEIAGVSGGPPPVADGKGGGNAMGTSWMRDEERARGRVDDDGLGRYYSASGGRQ